ncbi:transposase, partial [Aneurinibacillus aneurinilyticus]|nr:transposase [Aneurinibacillus aneurinilyticus]
MVLKSEIEKLNWRILSPCVLFITKKQDTTYAATLLHTVQPGDLLLRDLGYFSLDRLKSIHEQGGYYISGVKHNVKIYFTKERTEEPKCAEDFIKDLAPGETMEVHHV